MVVVIEKFSIKEAVFFILFYQINFLLNIILILSVYDFILEMQNILESPPAPRGRPSYRYLAERAARQRAREAEATVNVTATANATATSNATATATATFSANVTTVPTSTQDSTATQTIVRPPTRYRTYSLAFKLHVVAHANDHSLRSTSRHFGLERKTIREWIRQANTIQEQNRLHYRHRVPKHDGAAHPEMENAVYDMVMDRRAAGICVTGGMIRAEALQIMADTNFSASNGWPTRFLPRKRLVVRRVTTSGRELPKDAGVQVDQFLSECAREYQVDGFDRDSLLNGDETSIYMDPNTNSTYEAQGTRRVEAVTSGQQKTRISVCFTASASGTKLPALVLIPRKKPLKNFTAPNNLVVVYGTNGTFNESVVCEHFVPNVLVSYKNEKNMSNLHFLYDQAPCHMTKRVNETFAAASVRRKNVPKRMTPFLQQADVSWMSPIKSKYFLK